MIRAWKPVGGFAFFALGPDKKYYWASEYVGNVLSHLKQNNATDSDVNLYDVGMKKKFQSTTARERAEWTTTLSSLEDFDRIFGTKLKTEYDEYQRKVKMGRSADTHDFCRTWYQSVMQEVRKHISAEDIKDSWAFKLSSVQGYEFHGPNKFYDYSRKPDCIWSAKAWGWTEYLKRELDINIESLEDQFTSIASVADNNCDSFRRDTETCKKDGMGCPYEEDWEKCPKLKPGWKPEKPMKRKFKKDIVPGGKSEGKPDSDFDPKQIEMGIKVEMEHTDDKDLAKEIAKDHLTEFPDYYTRLKKMEDEAKKDEGKKKAEVVENGWYIVPASGKRELIEGPFDSYADAHEALDFYGSQYKLVHYLDGSPIAVEANRKKADKEYGKLTHDATDPYSGAQAKAGEVGDLIVYDHNRDLYQFRFPADDLSNNARVVSVYRTDFDWVQTAKKAEKIIPWIWNKAKRQAGPNASEEKIKEKYDKLIEDLSIEYGVAMAKKRAFAENQWVTSKYGPVKIIKISDEGIATVYSFDADGLTKLNVDELRPLTNEEYARHARVIKAWKSKEEIERRIAELSNRFLELTDMFKEANGLGKRVDDIIYTLASARSGILYELRQLQNDYEALKSRRYHKISAASLDQIGSDIGSLTTMWYQLDHQIEQKERELSVDRTEREMIMRQMEQMGTELQQAQKQFAVSPFQTQPQSRWYVRTLFSKSGGFNKLMEKTVDEFKDWLAEMTEEEVNQMVNTKAAELQDTVNKIKKLEVDLERLKTEQKEKLSFFDYMSQALGREVAETETYLVKIKKWAQKKPISWKAVATWLMDKVNEDLKKQTEAMIESMQEVDNRIRVDITPKTNEPEEKASSITFYASQFVSDMAQKGLSRKQIWDKMKQHYSKNMTLEGMHEVIAQYYNHKNAEGLWDKVKKYVKDLWDKGSELLTSLKNWNKEFEDLFFEEEVV